MNWLQALLLGAVQGLSEFLPISSSGHLVLFQKLLGVIEHSLELDIVVHLGTLLAIVTYYRTDLKAITLDAINGARKRTYTSGLRTMKLLIMASIPTAVIGLSLRDQFKSLFSNVTAVGFFLCITGILLYATRNRGGKSLSLSEGKIALSDVSIKAALMIGIAQGCAIAPGISRSGATIATALFCRVSRNSATQFSFLLSIPAVLGAALLELRDANLLAQEAFPLWIGFVAAYLLGLLGLSLVVKIVQNGKLQIFSGYLLAVGILTIVLSAWKDTA